MAHGKRSTKDRRRASRPPPSSGSDSSSESDVIPLDAPDAAAAAGEGTASRGSCGGRGAPAADHSDDSIAQKDDDNHDEDDAAGAASESGDHDDEDYVDASFSFFDPRPDDVPRLRSLLLDVARSLPVPDAAVHAHALAEAVAAQTRVGTTVRVDDGEGSGAAVVGEALGFITVLPVATHAAVLAPLLAAIGSATAAKDGASGGGGVWAAAAAGAKIGVVLSERVVNLPPALVPWLHTALWDELSWALEDEPTAALRAAYALTHFVIITDVYAQTGGAPTSKRRKAKQRRTGGGDAAAAIPLPAASEGARDFGFTRVEDGAWFRAAAAVALWPIPGESAARGGLTRQRLAMLVPAAAVPAARAEITAACGGEAAGPANR